MSLRARPTRSVTACWTGYPPTIRDRRSGTTGASASRAADGALPGAEGEHLLDHPKAERKSIVQPDRVADQLRRKAMAGVGSLGRARHAGLIPDPRCSGNP